MANQTLGVAESPLVPALPLDLSTATPTLFVGTVNPAVRVASARVPSVATTMADKQGPIPPVEGRASAAWEEPVAVAAIGNALANQCSVMFAAASKIWIWRESLCG